ncbi:DUF3526 domain-containing protein [Gimesia maris]|uniref:DUF3526 domain-containing protein n=1 Tax=Gimesia maris TaxID=122 RepID=UPI0018D92427|nr:DUF3526 domain-containing protein [Gimesia maris]
MNTRSQRNQKLNPVSPVAHVIDRTSHSPSTGVLLWWAVWLFWKSPGARWLMVAFTIMIGIASVCGYQTYQKRADTIEALEKRAVWNRTIQRAAVQGVDSPEDVFGKTLTPEETGRARIQKMIAPLPTSLAYTGGNFLATLNPSPMMILSAGVSDLWSDRFNVTAHSQLKNLQREEIANSYQLEVGTWDVTMIVVYFLPLIILAFTYNFIPFDREQGILRLILSNSIECRRWTVINLFVRIFIPVMIVLPVSILPVIEAWGSEQFQTVLVNAAVWGLAVILYGLFWMSSSLLVNSLGGSSLQNGITLSLFWVILVVLIPHGVARTARSLHPVARHHDLIIQERAFRASAEANQSEIKEAYYREHPQITMPTKKEDPYNQTRWDAIRLKVDSRMHPLIRGAQTQMQKRIEWCRLGTIFSPSVAFQSVQEDLAGTSLAHHSQFVLRASEYDEEFKEFFQPRMMSREQLTLADYEIMPTFQYQNIAWNQDLTLIIFSLFSLSIWTCSLFVIGFRRLRTEIALGVRGD